MIRILLVEDNTVVRKVLSEIIDLEDDLQAMAACENGFAALEWLRSGFTPDIVLADLNMPGMDGIELTTVLSEEFRSLPVLVLTMHVNTTHLDRAMAAGARGYLIKNGDMDELFSAIRTVYAGGNFFKQDTDDTQKPE
jgi:DNA-binding NarL/FixJ family response regulator